MESKVHRGKAQCKLMRQVLEAGQILPHTTNDNTIMRAEMGGVSGDAKRMRVKIPKSQAKVVNAEQMLQLQIEAAAKYYM